MLPGGVRCGCALLPPLSSLARRLFAGSKGKQAALAGLSSEMDADFGPGEWRRVSAVSGVHSLGQTQRCTAKKLAYQMAQVLEIGH